ncbi:MAG TPA: hypothetical protein VM052_05190 [Candidatus Limnocylindrales bacterium]|nr:hypothetical protein [Candidatus Limnocylindrales bacterium]
MNADLLFLGLDLALVVAALVLLLLVMIRRGSTAYLGLAALLIVLAIGVWYTAIRHPVLP